MTFNLTLILKQLGLDPFARGLQILDARELAADSFPRVDTDRPALIFHVHLAKRESITRALRVNYPGTHPLTLVQNNRVRPLTPDTFPRDLKISSRAALYLPPLPHASSPLTLANIMARLRAPVGGCPWDLEQTHESITRSLVEETYEVIEAISENDMPHLKEELGDLWLHVLFQTQIARDENEFALSDVGAELAAKLIRRHPHVFGDQQAHDAQSVLDNWEKIKQAERQSKGQTHAATTLDHGIPRDLPALTRAQKISERARRKLMSSKTAPRGKQRTEPQTLTRGRATDRSKFRDKIARARNRERVVGEMLLQIAQAAEEHGIDAERALHAASKAFAQKNIE